MKNTVTMENKMQATLETKVWNGTPINYHRVQLNALRRWDGVTFIKSLAYLDEAGRPRYVAVRNGEVVAVGIHPDFTNFYNHAQFPGASVSLIAPSYERGGYSVPVICEG